VKRILTTAAAAALLAAPATTLGQGSGTTGQPDIVTLAASSPKFSTLVGLVKRAGLVSALSGPGSLTVFAPTNAAFAKVPKTTLDALAADKQLLRSVLTYHVLKGAVPAGKVLTLNGKKVRTLNGAKVTIRITGQTRKSVYVNNSKVVKADLRASNGIVHAINRVLIPPASQG